MKTNLSLSYEPKLFAAIRMRMQRVRMICARRIFFWLAIPEGELFFLVV
jgi:hypothetical protein